MKTPKQAQADRATMIEKAISMGDVPALREFIEGRPCACLGCRDGESKCPCRMLSDQARHTVSYAALKRGKILRINTRERS